MNPEAPRQADLPKDFAGSPKPTRSQVRARAREIALVNGRSWQEATESDFAQARQELTGSDSKTAILETAPESERWDPLPGSPGNQAPTNASADEDDGGRSANQQLIEKGVADAAANQSRQANLADRDDQKTSDQ